MDSVINKEYEKEEKQLRIQYERWANNIIETCPEFFEDEKYSNPYYISIPDGWFEESIRIMIVGLEGYGENGRKTADDGTKINYNDFEKIQAWNYNYLRSQLGKANIYIKNHSNFWRRFRAISEFGVCCWSNIDKIHVRGSGAGKCKLSKTEREKLHQMDISILNEEIKILKPTHVVYFGFYGISLKNECPEVFCILYPKGLDDNSRWYKSIVPIQHKGICHIFAYHPAWVGKRKPKGYEDEVIDTVRRCIFELPAFNEESCLI